MAVAYLTPFSMQGLHSATKECATCGPKRRLRKRRRSIMPRAKGDGNKNKAMAKSDLPAKICVVCGLRFTWRKKWEAVWDDVKYCSHKCRTKRGQSGNIAPEEEAP